MADSPAAVAVAAASPPRAFEVLDSDDIELVSVATGRRVTLEVAAREGWVVCDHCGAPYEPTDVDLLREGDDTARCVSDVCRHRRSPLVTAVLPVDRIVVFAQTRMHREFREGVLFRLFYQDDERSIHPHFTLRERAPDDDGPRRPVMPEVEPRVQEENWAGKGLVITKRRRGKFVTWVPLGS
jgi:hypothetical protein